MSMARPLITTSLCLSLSGCAAWLETQGSTATINIHLAGSPSDIETEPITEIAVVGRGDHRFVAGRHHTLTLDHWHSYA
jgi:hypothetical protein